MDNFYQGFLIALVPSFVVAVITALITAKLTINQYCHQRLWDTKLVTYSRIMDQLCVIKLVLIKDIEQMQHGQKMTKDFWEKVQPASLEAKVELEKASMAGAYIVDDRATKHLEDFIKVLNYDSENWMEDLEKSYDKVSECIEAVRKIAKEDLQKEQKAFLF